MILIAARGVIEDGISSKENRFQCVLPDLPLNSSEMLSFLKDEPPIRCDDVEPWVFCGSDPNVRFLVFFSTTKCISIKHFYFLANTKAIMAL